MYGYANDSMFPLFATQLFGELVGLVYNAVYFRWSSGPKRKQLRKLYSVAFAVWCLVSLFSALALVGVFGQTKGEVGTMLGYVGVAFSLSMFSSPLGTLKHVVSTKNAASIPINMCVMILVSTTLWVGSGLADNDYFVAGVNGAGVLLSCVQIIVYYIYKPGRREEASFTLHHESPKNVPIVVSSPKDENYNSVFVESPAYKPMPSPVITVAA
ncbi:Bidirectional sugar transporter SWEET15 [Phytophthora cinnamomi]|uniref:Bidirectional sugar transporter SWEET15 n=1 Tax=Phytophthora cinnamomi TaxID=4785 RepID=UPI0035595838|nr:Bidirectional sugar transporter SWEET15 [Phytophthora cinnamomi]